MADKGENIVKSVGKIISTEMTMFVVVALTTHRLETWQNIYINEVKLKAN